jgi:hypothetical protein
VLDAERRVVGLFTDDDLLGGVFPGYSATSTTPPSCARSRARWPREEAPLSKTSEPGVYRRGGRYVVVFRDPSRKQRKRFARTFNEARDLKSKLRTDIKRGEFREEPDRDRITFEDYARQWIDSYAGRTSKGIRSATIADYRRNLEADAIPFLGKRRLAGIGPRDIKQFAAQVASRKVSHNTVRLALAPAQGAVRNGPGRRANPLEPDAWGSHPAARRV